MIKLSTPLDDKTVKKLKIGDRILLNGKIYVARDSAHKLFGDKPPFPAKGSILFYASPTPARKGEVIGSIGPTTASRMDGFVQPLLKLGLKGMIGKGRRSAAVKELIKKHNAVYFVVPGGTAALLHQHVKKAAVLAYPELGPEAVLEIQVMDFPVIVAIDPKGRDLFEEGKKKYRHGT